MTTAQLDTLFSSVPELRWLDLTGGEVTARRDIEAIGAVIRARLPKLAMLHFPTGGWSTNATVAAADALRWPAGPRLIVTVSIDGPPQVHNEIRGVSGAWEHAIATLRALRQAGHEVYPGMTLQPGNTDLVDATVVALRGEFTGFSHAQLHVNVAHSSPHYFHNTDCQRAPQDEVRAAIAGFRAQKGVPADPVQAIEASYLALLDRHFETGRSPIPCRSGELSAYIAPDGRVHACTIDPRSIGHLKDHAWDLGALWDSQPRRALADEIAADRCVGCWTPCEAYQTLLASPAATAIALLKRRRPAARG